MTSRNPHGGPAGWLVDPADPTLIRWWDGRSWTDHTQANPQQWNPYRVTGRVESRSWWRRKRVVVPSVVLALLVAVGLAGGEEPTPGPVGTAADGTAPTSEVPASPWEPSPSASPEPEPAAVTTPAVVETPMPDLVGLSAQSALDALTAAELVVGRIVREPSDQPVGTVLAQASEPGQVLVAGSEVSVTVAAPYPTVARVVGDARSAAARALRRAGFEVRVRTETRSSGRDGVVLRQSPVGRSLLAPGSVVTLVVADVRAPAPPPPPPVQNCTDGYDPCLEPASDYDCASGSGNGPAYASGPIYVTGSDPYDLDSDGDGVACES